MVFYDLDPEVTKHYLYHIPQLKQSQANAFQRERTQPSKQEECQRICGNDSKLLVYPLAKNIYIPPSCNIYLPLVQTPQKSHSIMAPSLGSKSRILSSKSSPNMDEAPCSFLGSDLDLETCELKRQVICPTHTQNRVV